MPPRRIVPNLDVHDATTSHDFYEEFLGLRKGFDLDWVFRAVAAARTSRPACCSQPSCDLVGYGKRGSAYIPRALLDPDHLPRCVGGGLRLTER
jgi:hypothetical protein